MICGTIQEGRGVESNTYIRTFHVSAMTNEGHHTLSLGSMTQKVELRTSKSLDELTFDVLAKDIGIPRCVTKDRSVQSMANRADDLIRELKI